MLVKQTEDAYHWTDKLICAIPYDQWNDTPAIIESNISWQVGHLILSYYYHSIMVITGHQTEIIQKIPLKEYDTIFTDAAPKNAIDKAVPEQLHQQLHLVAQKSVAIIGSLLPADLESELVPSPIPHPIAKNKWEALDWNIKHTMWHCGQIGMLKRVIQKRYDFGLKKKP